MLYLPYFSPPELGITANVLGTYVRPALMDHIGLEGCVRLHGWLAGLTHLVDGLAPHKYVIFVLNPLLQILQCGYDALDRSLQTEAASHGIGPGALGAAETNLLLLPSLVMPNFFTKIFEWVNSIKLLVLRNEENSKGGLEKARSNALMMERINKYLVQPVPYWIACGLQLWAAEMWTPWVYREMNRDHS